MKSKPPRGYAFFYVLLHIAVLVYLITAHYILYLKIASVSVPISIYLFYCFTIVLLLLKTLTQSSSFFIVSICLRFPSYKEILLSELPEEFLDISSKGASSSSYSSVYSKWGGLFNVHVHRHRHINPPELPQSKITTYTKIGFAIIGLGFTAFAGYNYNRAVDAAIRSADAAVRAADLSALQQGIIDKEEYYRRHPGDRYKS